MEKFIIVIATVFVLYFVVGYITRLWARFAACIEMLGYFDDGSYDPSEKQFLMTIKKLEHERRVPRWWVFGASIVLVTMTSGVFVGVTELRQVFEACVVLLMVCSVAAFGMLVVEQLTTDSLRKKRVGRYASKLANPQF